jgi:WD40 repeat protein
MKWLVTVTPAHGERLSREFFEGEIVLGSDHRDGVFTLVGNGIAPRHAKLWLQPDRLYVEDLNSETGTLVHGSAVTGRVDVKYPAELKLGETKLHVAISELSKDAADPPDVTLRIKHPVRQSPKYLAPPTAPDVTGRIYHQCSEQDARLPSHASSLAAPETATDFFSGETITLNMRSEDIEVGPRLSLAMDYVIQKEIARGGMGRIYGAEDSQLSRNVALKVSTIKDRKEDEQFLNEAKVLAQLAHPNIVPIHSVGTDGEGRPFYVMKEVKGRTLQFIIRKLASGDPDIIGTFTRLRLLNVFLKVCDAVAFAHAKGYLHRDLKPENIMIGEFGEVLVMDWGLAKVLRSQQSKSDQAPTEPCEPESVPFVEGTPLYMSPEQAEGMYGDLDERSDIYSLGGVLFAILTLRPPVTASSVRAVLEKVKKGQLETMTLPSGSLAERTQSPLEGNVPEALRAVTYKALSRQRELRYSTVKALVADIESYQAGFATTAENATMLRQLALFVKRNRAASALAALLIAVAAVFTLRLAASESLAQANALRAETESKAAVANAHLAISNAKLAEVNAAKAEEQKQIAEAKTQQALAEKEEARRASGRTSLAYAEAAQSTNNAQALQKSLADVPSDLRTQPWHYLNRFLNSTVQTIHAKNGSPWKTCVPHPQRPGVLVTLQNDNWIRSLDLSTGVTEDLLELKGEILTSLSISPDGSLVAVVRKGKKQPGNDNHPSYNECFKLVDGSRVFSIENGGFHVPALKFNADGSKLMVLYRSSTANEGLALYDVQSAQLLWKRSEDELHDAEFAPNPEVIHLISKTRGWMEINILSGQPINKPSPFNWQSNPPVGPILLEGGLFSTINNLVRRHERTRGGVMYDFRLPSKLSASRDIGFLANQNLLITLVPLNENSAMLDLRDAKNGFPIASTPIIVDRNRGRYWSILTHEGSSDVAVFRGDVMKVWHTSRISKETPSDRFHASADLGFTLFASPSRILQLSLSSRDVDSTRLYSMKTQLLLPAGPQDEEVLSEELIDQSDSVCISRSQESGKVAVWSRNKKQSTLRVYNETDGALSETSTSEEFGAYANIFALSPDGEHIWGGRGFYETSTGKILRTLDRTGLGGIERLSLKSQYCWTNNQHVAEIALITDGESEGDSDSERALLLWNTSATKAVKSVSAPNARAIAASPDGQSLAEGGKDHRLRIRDAKTLKTKNELRVHDAPVLDVAWNPSLPYVATSGEDLRVRIWNLHADKIGEELVEEIGFFEDLPSQLHWSPDGQTLAFRGQVRRYYFTPKSCQSK